MDPLIRQAQPGDVERLAQLRWQMHTEGEPATESYAGFLGRFRHFADQAVESEAWRIWLAEMDGRIVGNVWLQLVQRVPRPTAGTAGAIGYLTNVFVVPTHRNVGIGSLMLTELLDWTRSQAVEVVVVWPADRSIPYYRRMGFTASEALERFIGASG